MVRLTGQYTLADFKAAQGLHRRQGRLTTWAMALAMGSLGAVTLSGLLLALMGQLPWMGALFPALLLGFWALFHFVLLPRQLVRLFTQQKELSIPFQIEVSDEAFDFRNQYGSSHIPWEDFTKWKGDDAMLLLYRSDMLFHMIPRRLFQQPDDEAYLMAQLRSHAVPLAGHRFPVSG